MEFTIEQARILAGLTQVQIADRMGMSEKTYIQYEKYRKIFRMDHAWRFAKITGRELTEIKFFDDELKKFCS